MANSKRRCSHCKSYKLAEEMKIVPVGAFCNQECWYLYATKSTDKVVKFAKKVVKKKVAKRKKDFYLDDKKRRKKAAKEACHAYIRARDKGKDCPDCGRRLGEHFHAGHFFESHMNPLIRYDENNIHGQLAQCNYFRDDPVAFKETVIDRIGMKKYLYLQRNKGGRDTRTASHLLHIEQHYKRKLKALSMD